MTVIELKLSNSETRSYFAGDADNYRIATDDPEAAITLFRDDEGNWSWRWETPDSVADSEDDDREAVEAWLRENFPPAYLEEIGI